MSAQLVLSLFPGIGLLDRGFEDEGFCVVRGPDLLWGGDVKKFHPPAGKFDGVVGGPPCQAFSQINQSGRLGIQPLAENLIPEFERCVREAQPAWFLMENVPPAPLPVVAGFVVRDVLLNNRSVPETQDDYLMGPEQNRVRRFSFGTRDGRALKPRIALFENPTVAGCVTANATQWERGKGKNGGRSRSNRSWAETRRMIRLQGLPENTLDKAPFTVEGAQRVVGNGVPYPLARAIALAVREALGLPAPLPRQPD